MTLRIASLGLVCALLASGAVACGGGNNGGGDGGGKGGSGGTMNPGGSGGMVTPCTDGAKNQDETGVDCGGLTCIARCDVGAGCESSDDCKRLLECSPGKICVLPISCDNEVQDGTESDVDCGGTCDTLCDDGKKCVVYQDCKSQACSGGICVPATCTDKQPNGTETDIDCGGNNAKCARCEAGKKCLGADDCASLHCDQLRCLDDTCDDGIKNGTESDKDCGGSDCDKCPNDSKCTKDSDCESGICTGPAGEKVCSAPSCIDMVQNQDETATDCGGSCTRCDEPGVDPCSKCDDGLTCARSSDCKSGVCDRFKFLCNPPTCADGVKNQDETGVDCGGSCPGLCPDGDPCLTADDCASGVCFGVGAARVCQPPACDDSIKNGGETDIDCGGDNECPRCKVTQPCLKGADCDSGVCTNNTCKSPTCDDGTKNGNETDRDCGGPDCKKCTQGQACAADSDCDRFLCVDDGKGNFNCKNPFCGDNVIEGDEECEDLNNIDNDTCTNKCKRPACGDGIKQQVATWEDANGDTVNYGEKTIKEPVVLSPFRAAGHVCSKGATCAEMCSLVDDEDAPEHGICQALGYGSALGVSWGNGAGDADRTMPHAGNWSCTKVTAAGNAAVIVGYTCKGSMDSSSGDDCSASEMLFEITCQGEQCDDGADNDDMKADACRKNCRSAWCGDGVVDKIEQCDNGDKNDDLLKDACRTNCAKAHCGDAVVDTDEECDDGNQDDTDACYGNCTKNPNFGG